MALVGRKHAALHRVAMTSMALPADEFATLVDRMCATLARLPGLALAAPQIGRPLRVFVTRDDAVFGDPQIVALDGRKITAPEGCLSIPGRSYEVERYEQVTVTAHTHLGRRVEATYSGVKARMIQHELDHLNGILISDRWPEIRR